MVKTFTKYLNLHPHPNLLKFKIIFIFKKVIFHNFFAYLEGLLHKYGTNQLGALCHGSFDSFICYQDKMIPCFTVMFLEGESMSTGT